MKDMQRKGTSSLRTRLMLFFVLVAVIPLLITTFISTKVSNSVIIENAKSYNGAAMRSAAQNLDSMLSIAVSQGESIAKDYDVQWLLRQGANAIYSAKNGNALDERLATIHGSGSHVRFRTFVVTKDGQLYKSSYGYMRNEPLHLEPWYQMALQSNEPIWFSASNESFVMKDSLYPVITYACPIKDMFNGQTLGIALVEVDASYMMSGEFVKQLLESGKAGVVDAAGKSMVKADMTFDVTEEMRSVDSSKETGSFSYNYGEGEYYFSFHRLASGWYLVSSMSMEILTEDVSNIANVVIPAVIILLILTVFLAITWVNDITNPIRGFIDLMHRVEKGDLSAKYYTEKNDEIGQLANSYNSMLDKLNEQMRVIEDKQREVTMAQYEVLVAQINPHFLYNTLDSINGLARTGKVEQVTRVVELLTKFFRGVLSKGRETISLEEEISYIKTYLQLQQIRYGEYLQFTVEYDPALGRYQVLKMLLQPLVENAIYHGIKSKREAGHILVSVAELDDVLCFVVEDTGMGMDVEQLEVLTRMLEEPVRRGDEQSRGYGIRNVNDRIRLYYGQNYGLFYESQPGVGTSVTVRIPKVRDVNAKGFNS